MLQQLSKSFFICLLISLISFEFTSPAQAAPVAQNNHNEEAQHTQGVLAMRIMVAKLRALIFNISDIEKLEQIGLSHADATLMRLTLQEKINQTQAETLGIIRSL